MQQQQQQQEEQAAAEQQGEEADTETQSIDSEETLSPPEPEGPRMPRPGYLRLRPGQGVEGMPRVEVSSADYIRAYVEIQKDTEDEETTRAKKRRRKRRAGGLRAGAELECARGAFEFVMTRMGPAVYREFMELMG